LILTLFNDAVSVVAFCYYDTQMAIRYMLPIKNTALEESYKLFCMFIKKITECVHCHRLYRCHKEGTGERRNTLQTGISMML
jgi:hypothetical protein